MFIGFAVLVLGILGIVSLLRGNPSPLGVTPIPGTTRGWPAPEASSARSRRTRCRA